YIFNLLKRLLPSIIVVVFTTAIISIFLLPKSIIEKTFNEAIASLLYYQNWQLAISNTDYLDQEQMSTPFEHFWAMSIQGQFYLIWFLLFTVIFLILKRNNVNGMKLVNIFLSSLFVLSFSYSVYLTEVNQPWAYFDVGFGVWEFSLGVIISRVEVHQYAIGVRRFMRKSPSDYFWNSQFRSTNSHKESAQVFFSVYLIRKRLLSN